MLDYKFRVLQKWWEILFFFEAAATLGDFTCASGIMFRVPVRVGEGVGSLRIGHRVGFGWPLAPMLARGEVLLQPRSSESVIEIGSNTIFSNNITIISMGYVRIGEHCLIGDLTTIFDCDFHSLDPNRRLTGVGSVEPVEVGDNVWIGSRVQILKGVTIGDNAVIGAGSVVVHDVPANSVAVGVPAKVVKFL